MPTPRPLIQLARAAGCAAKVSQADLRAARGQGLDARTFFNQVSVFENVRNYLADGLCPAGPRRNLQYAAPNVTFSARSEKPSGGGLRMLSRQGDC